MFTNLMIDLICCYTSVKLKWGLIDFTCRGGEGGERNSIEEASEICGVL